MSAAKVLHVRRTNDVFEVVEAHADGGDAVPVALMLGAPGVAERMARELVRETNRARLSRRSRRGGSEMRDKAKEGSAR